MPSRGRRWSPALDRAGSAAETRGVVRTNSAEEIDNAAGAARGNTDLARVAGEWESQQDIYRPERNAGLAALIEAASIGPARHELVVDLACGTGSITACLLDRYPRSRVVGVDRDPVLLALANAVFDDDSRVSLRRADLTDKSWPSVITDTPRAVLTAAAMHWLDETTVRRVYHQLADLLPEGGVYANLDWFPLDHANRLTAFADKVVKRREAKQLANAAGMSWSDWWSLLARQEELREAFTQREALQLARSAEFIKPAAWHERELINAGFSETAVIWRSFSSAVLVAVR